MTRPPLELADVIRRYGDAYRQHHPVSPQQARVMTRIRQCRTAALGGHVETCPGCDFRRVAYNSCRDRHCPKCQATKQVAWVEARVERLLPVPYFHVVFTLPHALNPVALRNPAAIYDLLFRAASAALLVLAADRRHLGAQVGITAVLHTWGQNLLLHPHLHCVVTGGGLSPDGGRWVEGRRRFLIGVRALASLFRGKFLAGLKRLFDAGSLALDGDAMPGTEAGGVRRWLGELYAQRWVVYAKPPFSAGREDREASPVRDTS
ncbi:MAG: putative transposase [Gemmataceae bacterium]|nr:putative transposase [Gemmataceae bacterium]